MASSAGMNLALTISADVNNAVANVNNFGAALDKATGSIGRLSNVASDLASRLDAMARASGATASAQNDLTQAANDGAQAGQQQATALQAETEALNQTTQATREAASATRAKAESDDEATARIRAMVSASVARAEAEREGAAITRAAAATSSVTAERYAADLAAQNAQMRQASTEAARMAQAEREAAAATHNHGAANKQAALSMEELAGRIDPAIAKLQRLDAAERDLRRAQAAGLVGGEDFTRFAAQIEEQRRAVTEAGAAVHEFSLNNAFARREMGRLLTDVVSGNWGRFEQTSFTLANATGALGLAFSTTGAAVLGVVAGLGTFAAAAAQGALEDEALNKALILTAGYVGATRSQLDEMAPSLQGATGTIGQAREALQQLVAGGRVTADQIKTIGPAVVDMANLTGQSVDKVVAEFTRLGQEPTRASQELNQTYHYLTASTYEQIEALERQGRAEDAANLAQKAFADYIETAAPKVTQNLGYIETALLRIKQAASGAWDGLKAIGRDQTTDQQIQALQERRARAGQSYDTQSSFGVTTTHRYAQFSAQDQQRLNALIVQKAFETSEAQAQQQTARANDQGVSGQAYLDAETKKYQTAADRYADEIKRINTATAQAIRDGGDRTQVEAQAQLNMARAREAFEKASNRLSAPVSRSELGAATAQAQQQLRTYADAYTNAERTIESAHRAGTTSDQQYWDARRTNIQAYEQQQVEALQRERSALSSHAATAAERIRIDQQVAGIDAQISRARADAAARQQQLDDQEHQANQRKADDAARVQEMYLRATGRSGEADALQIQQQLAPQMREAQRNGDTETVRKLQVILDTSTAKAQLRDLMSDIERVQSAARGDEQLVQDRMQAGVISQADGQKQLLQLHQQTLATLNAELPKVQALAAATADPAALQQVNALKQNIQEMALQADPVTSKLQSGIQGALSNTLSSIGTRRESATDTLRNLGVGILQPIESQASQQLSKYATSQLSGGINWISKLLGGSGSLGNTAGSAASATTAATAMTTAGTTAATAIGTASTSMATAITTAGTEVAQAIAAAGSTSSATGGSGGGLLGLFGVGGNGGADLPDTPDVGNAITDNLDLGFSTGGYTGDVSHMAVAGVVHGREHVTRAAVVAQPGARSFLDDFNAHGMAALERHVPGYASGGYVAPNLASRPAPRVALTAGAAGGGRNHPLNLHVVNVPGLDHAKDYLNSRAGEDHVLNIIGRNPTKVRRSIGN